MNSWTRKGGDNMSSPAKRAANKKYLRSMEQFSIRVTPEQAAAVREHARSKGLSVNSCILEAISASMGGKLPPGKKDAQRGAHGLSGPLPGQMEMKLEE